MKFRLICLPEILGMSLISPSACSLLGILQRRSEQPLWTAVKRLWLTYTQVKGMLCINHSRLFLFLVENINEQSLLYCSGIGYFTLPYLVHANASHVHACEWNPDAIKALRRNLQINGVTDRCTVHQGDNRQVKIIFCTLKNKRNICLVSLLTLIMLFP